MFGINAVGRRTGEALAVLETAEQANLALQRDHHYIQQRYIEVTVEWKVRGKYFLYNNEPRAFFFLLIGIRIFSGRFPGNGRQW